MMYKTLHRKLEIVQHVPRRVTLSTSPMFHCLSCCLFSFWLLYCLSFFDFTAFDYPFVIFKLSLCISSNDISRSHISGKVHNAKSQVIGRFLNEVMIGL
jgi:hypothetical protein